ncbi:uncharacterized protein LOC134853428 [Symsagittifera roscoffensis]|uniref:uncharacterized protein LOC134853428 n=1 Tax=Symsagittifera roscoffensis TaxID=84072 RepID=UPI00307C8A36
MSSKLTALELEDYREVFNDFDADGSGQVSNEELRKMFQSLGQEVTQKEVKELVAEVDKDGNGEVDFDEFCEMMTKKTAEQGEVDIETELKDVFKLFDRNNQGYISFGDLKKCLQMLSINLPDDKIQNMMREASSGQDGRVYYDDFRYMYFCYPDKIEKRDFIEMAKRNLTKLETEEMREVFDDFDTDGSGTVNIAELRDMLELLGQKVTESELKKMMGEVDVDGSGEVTFEEFCDMMAQKQTEGGNVDIETELRDVFRMFDKKDQGYITYSDLKQILKMLSISLPDEKIQNMMAEASSGGDNRVYFDDFRYMYFC